MDARRMGDEHTAAVEAGLHERRGSRRRCAAAVAATLVLWGCATGERRPPQATRCAELAQSPTPVVAGSGAALAFASRALAGTQTRVAESIGTAGALRAVANGDIDVGLSLRPAPPSSEVTSVLLAEVPLIIASGPAPPPLPAQPMRADPAWARDPGLRWILREPGDGGFASLERARPTLAAAIASRRGGPGAQVAWTDQEAVALLRATPGAVALLDAGTARAARLAVRVRSALGSGPRIRLYGVARRQGRGAGLLRRLQRYGRSEEARRAGYR